MLTGNEILLQVDAKRLVIEPFDPACIGPNSYDVHLAPDMFVYREAVLDTRRENRGRAFKIPEEGLVLQPGTLYLGATVEHTECTDLIPMYEGRSSMGRLGLFSHITAGFGDVGFRGRWTLELAVIQPVRVYAGMRIGQLFFHRPDGEILHRYDGKYQGQQGATYSRAYRDREWGMD